VSKNEVKIEGRSSNEHTHRDGTSGRDVYAARVSYSRTARRSARSVNPAGARRTPTTPAPTTAASSRTRGGWRKRLSTPSLLKMIERPQVNKYRKHFLFLDLPEESDYLYAGLFFQFGSINEGDEDFGLTHLLEHYLISKLKTREDYFIDGEVDLASVSFYTKIKVSETNKVKLFFDFFTNPDFTDHNLLEAEKKALRSEVTVKTENTDNRIFYYTIGERLHHQRVVRSPLAQTKYLEKYTLDDLKRRYLDLKKNFMVATMASQLPIDNQLKKYVEDGCAKSFILSSKELPPIEYSKKLTEQFELLGVPIGFTKVLITFPAYTLLDDSGNRGTLRFISQQIRKRFANDLRPMGIYHINSERVTTMVYGMCKFSFMIPNKILNEAIKQIDKLLYKKLSDEELAYIKDFNNDNEKAIRNDWKSNDGRLEWYKVDVSNFGDVIDPEVVIKAKVTEESVNKVYLEIFQKESENLLLFSSKNKG